MGSPKLEIQYASRKNRNLTKALIKEHPRQPDNITRGSSQSYELAANSFKHGSHTEVGCNCLFSNLLLLMIIRLTALIRSK